MPKDEIETSEDKAIFECDQGHQCTDDEIPGYGLDIYCPTCLKQDMLSPLDRVA